MGHPGIVPSGKSPVPGGGRLNPVCRYALAAAAVAAAVDAEGGEHADAGDQEGHAGDGFDAGLELPGQLLGGVDGLDAHGGLGNRPGVESIQRSKEEQRSSENAEPTSCPHENPPRSGRGKACGKIQKHCVVFRWVAGRRAGAARRS